MNEATALKNHKIKKLKSL